MSLGYVTSAVFSPALKEWIGLALVARHSSAVGTELVARDPLRGGDMRVRIVPPAHFDPESQRIRA
jgi:methylglutamate dehydrogenase subunit C